MCNHSRTLNGHHAPAPSAGYVRVCRTLTAQRVTVPTFVRRLPLPRAAPTSPAREIEPLLHDRYDRPSCWTDMPTSGRRGR